VVDMTGGYEGRDPVEDYRIINRELELYADELADRPRIVVANKTDMPGTEDAVKRLAAAVREDSIAAAGGDEFADSPIDPKLYLTSAVTGKGVKQLNEAIGSKVRVLRAEARAEAEAFEKPYEAIWEHRREARDRRFQVVRLDEHTFRVEGPQVERWVIQTDWDNEEAVAFLQHRLKRAGVDDALAKAGARDGDEVQIVECAFDYQSGEAREDIFQELED